MQPQNPSQPQPEQQPQPPYRGPASPYPAAQQAAPEPNMQPVVNASQYPVDYLNQIATPLPVKKVSPLLMFGLIGGILIATAAVLFMIVKSTAPPDVSTQIYALQARLDTLNSVTNTTGPRLAQNDLSGINSTLGTTIKSMQANLKTYMTSKGYKDTKKVAAAKKTEISYADKLTQSLNDAYLTGTLDRSYSSEITYQLTVLKSKMQKLKAAANSKAFTEFYNNNMPSIDAMSEQLSRFQSTQ